MKRLSILSILLLITFIDSNLEDICLLKEFYIDNALETLTSSIVEVKGIAIRNCEGKFDSIIINDDLKLLIRLRSEEQKKKVTSTSCFCYEMKIIWRNVQKEIKKRCPQFINKNFENKFGLGMDQSHFGNYLKKIDSSVKSDIKYQ